MDADDAKSKASQSAVIARMDALIVKVDSLRREVRLILALSTFRGHDLWLVWSDKDFEDFGLASAGANVGFKAVRWAGCDRKPGVPARGTP